MKYILAHDLGTSGNKATLFSEEGSLVASVTQHYPVYYSNGNWAEQDPTDWWNAVVESTQQLVTHVDPADIAAVSFSGQMMGCVCVDKAGTPPAQRYHLGRYASHGARSKNPAAN